MRFVLVLLGTMCMVGCSYEVNQPMDAERKAASIDVQSMTQSCALSDTDFSGEAYDQIVENRFLNAAVNPLSTFSIDVDTASYSNVRRFLKQGQLPPAGAVRIEEMLNYFPYEYPPPSGDEPFSASIEMAGCPWNSAHRLARIALKGREINSAHRPVSNLVFLLDVSGSMAEPNKLPLVKSAIKMLVDNFGENDRVAIVVYAGASGLVLPSTTGDQRDVIHDALERLNAGGGTNGGAGVELAYKVAVENYIAGGVNRVILCTDGDFNIGTTNQSELVQLIESKAQSGVYLSVLGFGMGNYQDSTLEKLADHGNGNYGYIDTLNEARKVFVEQMTGTLITIAKDVKIQVDFNPARVAGYRLIGYENRMLQAEDFQDDAKDAGEIGAGHTVTALYEIVPVGSETPLPQVDPSQYQETTSPAAVANEFEVLTLRLRYKDPDGSDSRELRFTLQHSDKSFAEASPDFQFATAIAAFGMLLRDSEHRGTATLDAVLEIARANLTWDPHGYRAEFVELVERARSLKAGNQLSKL
ncbi:von Willebrand factor [Symmachiella macrocystis]|uniref:von Willebrand factor n=1 Tax=Symmachiella macrocystis TaxID=2527985 RepID=A0A5C6BPW3_9PLAN|nr:VWA domain-containing protein [Symmachiella macrocystis]TWU13732.1 von Willebrand factor [Symmachiella macrocystis]